MFSNSRIQCYKSCRRMYLWKYIHNVVPVESSAALQNGTSYHDKVRQINENGDFERDGNVKTNAMADAYKRLILPKLGKIASAEECWTMYLGGHGVCGIIDAIDENGTPIEFKTTSSPVNSSEYMGRIGHDEQIKLYMLACAKTRIKYAIMQTPTIRQKKDETDDEFEKRLADWYDESKVAVFDVYVPVEQLAKYKQELIATMDEMELCNLFYGNPNNCMKYGSLCEYAQICETEYDPDNEYVGFERRREVNG